MALQAVHNEETFHVGDTVRVHQKVREDEPEKAKAHGSGKTRTQVFEGTVIAIRGQGASKSFMVRRLATGGIGVERIFPISSPIIERIEVAARGAVRRAKLYYLREKSAREVAEITKRYARKHQVAKRTVTTAKKRKTAPRKTR